MEFDSANTKEELPLTLLKLKNIELENNLLLEKQKYILLQSELESTKLIASKHVDIYKSECMRLKEIILMLENDYNSFKKKMKNQEVVKNLCKKIKKIEETVSSKHENLEENDTEREKNYAKESELRNKSVIVDINSGSDGYVQLSSILDNAFIKLKNDSRSQMEKNLLSESLPFFEVESLRGKEKSVEIADVINNRSHSLRKRFKCSDCVCYSTTLETSCENGKRKKSGSKSSKDKSETDEVELNDDKDRDKENESEGDEEIKQSNSENENKSQKIEQEKDDDVCEDSDSKKGKQIVDRIPEEMKIPKKVKVGTGNNFKKTAAVNSCPTEETKADGRNDSGERFFVSKKKIADPTIRNLKPMLEIKEKSSSKLRPNASKTEPKAKLASKFESKGISTSKIDSKDVVNGDGENVFNKRKNADSPKSMPKSKIKEKSTSKLEPKEKLISKSEPKVKSALKSMSKGASTSKLESISKSELKNQTCSKKSSGRRTKSKKSGKSNSSEELRMTIRHILKNVDFDTTTFADILNRLGTRYKDLTPWKAHVRLMIQEELIKLADELEDKEESSEAEKDDEPNAKKAKV